MAATSSTSDGSKVQVIVRCRPFLSKEILQEKSQKCIQFSIQKKQILIGKNKEFYFDEIFDEKTNQIVIFDQLVKPLVAGCLLGYNATIFAYGQTGSGKTHTMGTSMELISSDDEGIIPRAARYLFHEIESYHHGKVMNIRLSFLEIYNEEMRDLLHPEVPSRDISIREDHLGRIFFTGAREEIVTSVQDVFKFLERGTMNRSTGETLMNDASSRSHAIFTLSIEIYESQIIESKDNSDDHTELDPPENSKKKTTEISSYIHSKLHLVDLAGSERAKRTGAVGVRLKESVGINQGLLSLGKVIRALTTTTQNITKSGPQNMHVPYRESKLTRFLQDSLGGNSRTLMIACISPSELDIQETLTTLQYASRARAVQNKIKANISTARLEMDTNLIDTLRDQLLNVQAQLKEQQKLTALMISERKEREDELLRKFPGEHQSYINIAEVISEQKRGIILERLGGIQKILQNSVKYFDHGVDRGVIRIDTDTVNSWEDTVCSIHNSASILEDVCSLVKETSGESIASTVESLGGQTATSAQLIKKIQALQIELAECREDLKRDEEIFGEKVLELKQTRRALKKSQEEIARLTEQLEEKNTAAATGSGSGSGGGGQMEDKDHDSLEISRAVAASEPHVSQLMEDLELISKEKEKLGIEKEIAEKKCHVAISLAEKQKEEFDQSRHQLSRQLKELEIAIKMKQEVISSLTREQQEISSKADMYAAQILKLETESQLLKSKLKEISEETVHNDESARETQRIYESKIKTAQQEISLMRKQWRKEQERLKASLSSEGRESMEPPGSPHAGQSNDLLEELKSMKEEHKRLRLLLEEDDARQKQQLKILSQQMESYKKKAHDSQKQIKLLEARNIELQQSLGAQPRGANTLPPPPKSAGGNVTKEGSYLKRHSSGSAGTPSGKTSRPGSFSELPSPSSRKMTENPSNYTKQLVEKLITARTTSEEEQKFQLSLSNLQREKEKLEQEKETIQKKGENGEAQLRLQLKEMEGRVSKITKEMATKKKEYKKHLEHDPQWEGTEDEIHLKTEISESERTLRSLREYRAELTVRLDRGFLSSDDQQRLQEIKDELEANDAEIQLNQLHLLSLTKNHEKSPPESSSTVGSPSSVLYEEISRDILETLGSNPWGSSWNIEFISSLLHEIVEHRLKLEAITHERSSLQLQYDEKNTEFEQIVMVLHRTRNELNKRFEKQQKEYENKISFLIQQLRNSEVKLHENSLLLRSSFDMMEQKKKSMNEEEGDSGVDGDDQTKTRQQRPHTTPNMNRTSTLTRSLGHPHAQEDHQEMKTSTSSSADGSSSEAQEENMKLINDLKRKLDTERCRREILEKRNGELMREMRRMTTSKGEEKK